MSAFALLSLVPALAQEDPVLAGEDPPHLFVGGGPVVRVTEPSVDLFALSQEIAVAAPVADNAFLVAQVAKIESPVDGDVFVVGQSVRVDAPVGGDVYVLGDRVELTERGAVGGDVYAFATTVQVDGPVAGDVEAAANEVRIEGPIAGDASLYVGTLSFAGDGGVDGDLDYEAPRASAGLDDHVGGEVRFTERIPETEPVEEEAPTLLGTLASTVGWTLWSYLAHLLVGFVFLALGGAAAARIGRTLLDQPGRSLGLGFVVLVVLPVASALAIVTVVPMPLGFIGLAVFAVGLYVAQLFTAQALGDQILRRFQPGAIGSPWVSMAVGLAPLVLLAALPWVGSLVWLVATCLGLGAAWTALRAAVDG